MIHQEFTMSSLKVLRDNHFGYLETRPRIHCVLTVYLTTCRPPLVF